MFKLRGVAPLFVIGILGLIWMLVISEKGADWLAAKFNPPSGALPVAKILDYSGSIKLISHGRVHRYKSGEPSAPRPPVVLLDGDRLEVDNEGLAVFGLQSGDEFEVKGLASILFHLWNPRDPGSPVYVHNLQGDLKLLKGGVRGHAYVMRDGRLYLPGQKPSAKPMALTVLRSAPLDMEIATASEDAVVEAEDKEEQADIKELSGSAMPETLSNEYIDETIATRQGQLQKCWLSRLKETPSMKGQITVQFEITNRGQTRDVRVSDESTIGDEVLRKCVITVFERIVFRQYRGTVISLTYPLTFE